MLKATFVVLTGLEEDRWTPLTQLPDALETVRRWIHSPNFSCCTMQAGFRLEIDGTSWNQDAIDEIAMALTWFDAIEALLNRTEERHWVHAWEESSLTLTRIPETDLVSMEDVHPSGNVVSPRVEVPLTDLAREMLREGRHVTRWWDAIAAEIAAGRVTPTAEKVLRDNFRADLPALLDRIEWLLDHRT